MDTGTAAPKTNTPKSRDVMAIKRQPIVVQDVIPVLDTGRFEQMQRIATAMASTPLMPKALKGKTTPETVANCFWLVNQAVRWSIDPFALAPHAYVIDGKLGFEGKVIAAVVNADKDMEEKLSYEHSGEGDGRRVVVSGRLKGEKEPRTVEGTVGGWKTNNDKWKTMADQMLCYRGAREWSRRHMPGPMLGVYSVDEIEEMATLAPGENGTYRPVPEQRPRRVDYETSATEETPDEGADEPEEADLGEPFVLFDEYGERLGEHDTADAYLDAAAAYAGKEMSAAKGAAKAFHEHNQPSLDRMTEVIGGSRDNTKVASFFRLLNGKRDD